METNRFPFAIVLLLPLLALSASADSLQFGFYKQTCPEAEDIIENLVSRAVENNPGIAAGLIRLHFHDCFVRGCDASVLLDSIPGSPAEKQHPANHPSLRGFELIDEAKAALEYRCPNTVSCADVLAFAARDAARFTGGFYYGLPGGRRDGTVSRESEILYILHNAEELRDEFAKKGLSLEDMVALSGAHSIGVSHCSSFSSRLYDFNSTHSQDPSLHADLADYLKKRCPPPGTEGDTVDLDVATPKILDVHYYRNLKKGKGLLTSDQTLWASSLTADMVASFSKNPEVWFHKYAGAMERMGAIDVLTGKEGEIRVKCSVVNGY